MSRKSSASAANTDLRTWASGLTMGRGARSTG